MDSTLDHTHPTMGDFSGFDSFRFPSPPPRFPSPPHVPDYSTFLEQDIYADVPFQQSDAPDFALCAQSPDMLQQTSSHFQASQRIPACFSCKGQKYVFTSYFHNPKMFPEPPHHLLAIIEQSYFLKDRLKSLLLNYAMRSFESSETQYIEKEVTGWEREVARFATYVLCSATGFELETRPLDDVKRWAAEMSKQLVSHVQGRRTLEMPRGRLQVLLSEFRRAWEAVWKGYLANQISSVTQNSKVIGAEGGSNSGFG